MTFDSSFLVNSSLRVVFLFPVFASIATSPNFGVLAEVGALGVVVEVATGTSRGAGTTTEERGAGVEEAAAVILTAGFCCCCC